jgi:hypothetical protein
MQMNERRQSRRLIDMNCLWDFCPVTDTRAYNCTNCHGESRLWAVTVKNVVLRDIKPQLVLHRRHIMSPLQRSAGSCYVSFEVFTAVTMKNAVFCDKTLFVPHRRHITSPLQSSAGSCYVSFEVFTAMTMKNAVFWDIKTLFVLHRRHIASPL